MGTSTGKRSWLINGLVLTISAAVSLVGVEIVLRKMAPKQYYVYRPGIETITNPIPGAMPGIEGEALFYINSSGIRGDEFSDDQVYRILALGGSTTECFYLDTDEAWPYLLQELLSEKLNRRIWVGNVGRSGHNSRHHMVQVEKLLEQYPELDAVMILVGVNDFHQHLATDIYYRPLPPFESLSTNLYHALLRRAFGVHPPQLDFALPFYKQTVLWGRLRHIKYLLMNQVYRMDEGGTIYIEWREYRKNATGIRERLPDLTPRLDEYARNLRAIIRLAKERGARVIFLTQPTIWRSDLSEEEEALIWMGGVGKYYAEPGHEYYSVAALTEGMKMFNDRLREICLMENIEYIDLASALPKDTTVFYDDCHFNESGAVRVAQEIASYFVASTGSTQLTSQ